ncbi:MAG: RluA family pseudouridine synthase [Candidatus Obscuribacterales bacterium]
MPEERTFEIAVDDLEDASRLDQFLVQFFQGEEMSRSRVQKLISDGLVLLNGKPSKAAAKLLGGELVSVIVPGGLELALPAEDIPLDVLFEDQHLIVVNKPAGMVTHPGAGVNTGTLVNALLYHCGNTLSGIGGVLRPGIVHRLDKDTSGVMLVAKSDRAHHALAAAIEKRTVSRVYLAVLEGIPVPPDATIDKPIGRHPTDRKKMSVVEGGKRAVTHYQTLRTGHKWCQIEAKLETGRTHQIRVHMASVGAPLVGDLIYNRKSTGSEQARKQLGIKGHALHSSFIAFRHPIDDRQMQFACPLPADLEQLLAALR